jgi:hypothetical protein
MKRPIFHKGSFAQITEMYELAKQAVLELLKIQENALK